MHLVRSGVGVRQAAPGVPELFVIDPDRIMRTCVDGALATVGFVEGGALRDRPGPLHRGTALEDTPAGPEAAAHSPRSNGAVDADDLPARPQPDQV